MTGRGKERERASTFVLLVSPLNVCCWFLTITLAMTHVVTYFVIDVSLVL